MQQLVCCVEEREQPRRQKKNMRAAQNESPSRVLMTDGRVIEKLEELIAFVHNYF